MPTELAQIAAIRTATTHHEIDSAPHVVAQMRDDAASSAAPAPVPGPLGRVALAQFAVGAANEELRTAIRDANDAGFTWAEIAQSLGGQRPAPSWARDPLCGTMAGEPIPPR